MTPTQQLLQYLSDTEARANAAKMVEMAMAWEKLHSDGNELWDKPRSKCKARVKWMQANRASEELAFFVLNVWKPSEARLTAALEVLITAVQALPYVTNPVEASGTALSRAAAIVTKGETQ